MLSWKVGSVTAFEESKKWRGVEVAAGGGGGGGEGVTQCVWQ